MGSRNYNWGPDKTWKINKELQAERVFTRIPIDNSPMEIGKDNQMIEYIIESEPTFIPCKLMFPSKTDSILSRAAQASCLNGLLIQQSNYDQNHLNELQKRDLQTYKRFTSTIAKENMAFLHFAQEDWAIKGNRVNTLAKPLRRYAYKMWKRKVERVHNYPQFYKLCKNAIPLSSVDQKVDVERIQHVLHLGSVAEFSKPSFFVKCVLDVSTLPLPEQQTYNSKLPVSQDANVDEIVKHHDIDIVISSSALKIFMDNNANEWDIPIIVKEIEQIQADGSLTTKNVIYIDKTLPKKQPDTVDFTEYCHKKLVKTNFCKYHGISHPNTEPKIYDPYCKTKSPDKELESPGKESEFEGSTSNVKICHNAQYDLWKMKLNSEESHLMKTRMSGKQLNILIRYKVDGCEWVNDTENRPVIILPKLEYQLELGANIATKQELAREWTSLFFRPFSHLYRIRLQSNTSEVVSIESVNLQKVNLEASHYYQYKPCDQLIVVYRLFIELSKLEPGNYLLHHTERNGPFAQIMKEEKIESISKKKLNIYDLHSEYKDYVYLPRPTRKPWCPIDVKYVLPIHTVYKRLPGTFQPTARRMKKNKGRIKKKSNKKNKKNKVTAAAIDVAKGM